MRRAALGMLTAACTHRALGKEAAELFARDEKGYCIACHQLPAGKGPETRNDVGPRLEGERMRSLGRDALRDILNDASQRNPDSVMPPFGRHRILDAREIDRLVEFLHALP